MKRFFIVFLLISVILSFSIIPAYAADSSNEIIILKQPIDVYAPFSNNGIWRVTLSVVAYGNDLSYQWEYFYNDSWAVVNNSSSTTPNLVVTSMNRDDGLYRCKISSGSNFVYTRSVSIEKTPTTFFSIISIAFRYVTSYVSLVINSLTIPGAPLYPLLSVLTIGIAVAAFLIVVKILKCFSWGL